MTTKVYHLLIRFLKNISREILTCLLRVRKMAGEGRKVDTFDDSAGEIDLVGADTVLVPAHLGDILVRDTDYTCPVVAVVDKKHLRTD